MYLIFAYLKLHKLENTIDVNYLRLVVSLIIYHPESNFPLFERLNMGHKAGRGSLLYCKTTDHVFSII